MSRAFALLVAVVLALSGCSGGSDTTGDTASSEPATAPAEPATTPDDEQADAAPAEPTPTSEPPTPTPEPLPSFFGNFDTVIAQTTAESGEGIRPLLAWEPIPEADHYGVYVYAPSGEAYWVWRGRDTSVFVGGATQIRDNAPGPSIVDGMTWAVIAYDADLLPVAASPLRPLSP